MSSHAADAEEADPRTSSVADDRAAKRMARGAAEVEQEQPRASQSGGGAAESEEGSKDRSRWREAQSKASREWPVGGAGAASDQRGLGA